MNIITLKSFISRLDFISEKIEYMNSNNYEIIIENTNNNEITGIFLLENNPDETIRFNTQIIKTDAILIFKSNYQKKDIKKSEVDTFVIINQESKSYFTPKTKYLIHLVEDKIKQAYIVNKKYKFENGINENHSRINMNNQEIFNNLKNYYESQITKRTR